jgi:hypothetical protein
VGGRITIPNLHKALAVVRNLETTHYMRNFAVIVLLIFKYSIANGQEVNLNQLYEVYQTDKIDTAFKRLSSAAKFSGRLVPDSQGKTPKIEGRIGSWTLIADIFKDRGIIKLQNNQKGEYQSVFAQAERTFYSHGDYARGSKTESRHTYAFSNTKEMNDGDLWLLLAEVTTSKKETYFEIQLRKYPYNDTD